MTKAIVCSSCGGSGHIARDCRTKRPGAPPTTSANESRKIDQEYMSLMAELGEGPPPDSLDNNRNDRNRTDNRFNRTGNSVFDRQQGPIKALMAPENSIPTPPSLIQGTLPPPPWAPNQTVAHPQTGLQAPPPGVPTMAPPPIWPPGTQAAQPPPPPPPLLPWLSNATLSQQPPPPGGPITTQPPPTTAPPLPPWQQQPPPVPPPQVPVQVSFNHLFIIRYLTTNLDVKPLYRFSKCILLGRRKVTILNRFSRHRNPTTCWLDCTR